MTLRAGLRGIAVALALGLSVPAGAAGFEPITIQTTPIENFLIGREATRFGEFEFRGGLVIASPDGDFGGLSGIDFAPDEVGGTAAE